MLHQGLKLDQLKQALRTNLCATCPYRAEGVAADAGLVVPLECEADCPVFIHLPILKKIGECLDPMVGSHEKAMDSTIQQILQNGDATPFGKKEGKLVQLKYHRNVLKRLLGELLNP